MNRKKRFLCGLSVPRRGVNGLNREGGLRPCRPQFGPEMTRKLRAVFLAGILLCAVPLAGTAAAADAGNTAGNDGDIHDGTDDSAGNESTGISLPFGLQVSSFVDDAKEEQSGPLGPLVASFAVSANPGNAPDHAGPPAWLFGESDEDGDDHDGNETDSHNRDATDRGPPDDAGPKGTRGPPADTGTTGTQGPPADVGPNGTQGPPADAGPDSSDRGPPADARSDNENGKQGPPSAVGPDRADSDSGAEDSNETDNREEIDSDEAENSEDSESDADDENESPESGADKGDRRGPPDHAGPP